MIKKTFKNVHRCQLFSFLMFVVSSIFIVVLGYLGTKGVFEGYTGYAVAMSIIGPASMIFWLEAFMAFTDIEEEMIEERRLRNQR